MFLLSSLPTKFKVLTKSDVNFQKTIFRPREGFMTKKKSCSVWTSSLPHLRSLRFSVPSFIGYLASKELPEEMQLVYNSSQPWYETCGKTLGPVVLFRFMFEKLGGVSENRLNDRTIVRNGSSCVIVFQTPKDDLPIKQTPFVF